MWLRLEYTYESEPQCDNSYVNAYINADGYADVNAYGKGNSNAHGYTDVKANGYADVATATEWPVLLQHTINKQSLPLPVVFVCRSDKARQFRNL